MNTERWDRPVRFAGLTVALCMGLQARAQTTLWTNTGGNYDWLNAAN